MKKSVLSRRGFLVQAGLVASGLVLGRFANAKQSAGKLALELLVAFEINNPGGFRYNRPYVAVWLEDSNGKIVRTVSLWVQAGRGSRWVPDLRRWHNGVGNSDEVVATISSATRMPGAYSVVWDGRNDKKVLLEQGDYYLCIETAREHGPYTLIREKFALGASAFKKTLAGNEEIKNVAVQFRKPS